MKKKPSTATLTKRIRAFQVEVAELRRQLLNKDDHISELSDLVKKREKEIAEMCKTDEWQHRRIEELEHKCGTLATATFSQDPKTEVRELTAQLATVSKFANRVEEDLKKARQDLIPLQFENARLRRLNESSLAFIRDHLNFLKAPAQ